VRPTKRSEEDAPSDVQRPQSEKDKNSSTANVSSSQPNEINDAPKSNTKEKGSGYGVRKEIARVVTVRESIANLVSIENRQAWETSQFCDRDKPERRTKNAINRHGHLDHLYAYSQSS
jgi:hypothetical protein